MRRPTFGQVVEEATAGTLGEGTRLEPLFAAGDDRAGGAVDRERVVDPAGAIGDVQGAREDQPGEDAVLIRIPLQIDAGFDARRGGCLGQHLVGAGAEKVPTEPSRPLQPRLQTTGVGLVRATSRAAGVDIEAERRDGCAGRCLGCSGRDGGVGEQSRMLRDGITDAGIARMGESLSFNYG